MSKSKKLPALQFYPGDWRKSIDIQSLNFHDRGVWFEMLMLMHDSERRGVLVLNGHTMTEEAIARCIGLDNQTFKQSLTTLLTSGVASREEETGAIFSRRMVRDENLRQIRSEAGKQGGNPALLIQKTTTQDKQKPTPSSSSSVSPSVKTEAPIKDDEQDPSMLAKIILAELSLSGTELSRNLTDVCRGELSKFRPAAELRSALVTSWLKYQTCASEGKLDGQFTKSAAKFFGEGAWANEATWPWKSGLAPRPKSRPEENEFLRHRREAIANAS